MLENSAEWVVWLLGLGLAQDELGVRHMVARAGVVLPTALAMIRLGDKRFISRGSAFDLVLGFMLGSVLSRAITGNAPFFPSLAAGAALVAIHWLLAAVAFRSDRFGTLVKGSPRTLIEDGDIRWENMRKGHIGMGDLLEAIRTDAGREGLEEVREARLERSGSISILTEDGKPRIFELGVEGGVQRVRIEIA